MVGILLLALAAQQPLGGAGQFSSVEATVTGRANGGAQTTGTSTTSGTNGASWLLSNSGQQLELGLTASASVGTRGAVPSLSRTARFKALLRGTIWTQNVPTRGLVKIVWHETAGATAGIRSGLRSKASGSVRQLFATASAPKNGRPNDEQLKTGTVRTFWTEVRGPWTPVNGGWVSDWTAKSFGTLKGSASATGPGEASASGVSGVTLEAIDARPSGGHAVAMSGTASANDSLDLAVTVCATTGEILDETCASFEPLADGSYSWFAYYPAPTAGDYVVKLTRPGYLTKAYAVAIDGEVQLQPTFNPAFGDLTGDNKIDAVDLGIANRIVGKYQFDDTLEPDDWQYFNLLDQDGDGYVSVAEAAPVTDNQGCIGE